MQLSPSSFSASSLGGGIPGISPKQTITNYKTNDEVRLRRIVTKSWNGAYAAGTVNGLSRKIGPFRGVNNMGDFLSRQNYSCGGSNQISSRPGCYGLIIAGVPQHCDGTGIPPSTTNTKFVADSSDYITFKKQQAVNVTYNDAGFGGDKHHASYVNRMAVVHGLT